MTGDVFQHETVLLKEAVSALVTDSAGVYVDATFGRGGHSRALLEYLGVNGRLLVIDKDMEAIACAQKLAAKDGRVSVWHGSFADIEQALVHNGLEKADGVLADLGVSSPQLDDAQRGFSFQNDGPLDMRMDVTSGISAAQWISKVSLDELAKVLKEYGEERFAKRIARAIVDARQSQDITSTLQLAKIVSEANPAWEKHKHPATRVFQAIRIFVNRELADLEIFLESASQVLAVGGRLTVISFHSLEDRLVKRFMRDKVKGQEPPPGVPIRHEDISRPFALVGKAVKPKEQELSLNNRARSAVMRVMERVSNA